MTSRTSTEIYKGTIWENISRMCTILTQHYIRTLLFYCNGMFILFIKVKVTLSLCILGKWGQKHICYLCIVAKKVLINRIHRKNYVMVSASILPEKMQVFAIIRFSPELAKMNASNIVTLQKSTMKTECCYHNKTDTKKIFYSKPWFLYTIVTCWQYESVLNVNYFYCFWPLIFVSHVQS